MKKNKFNRLAFSLIVAVLCCLVFPDPPAAAALDSKEEAAVLDSAESVFMNMAKGDYTAVWKGVTEATRRAIVRSIQKAVAKEGVNLGEAEIHADLESGGRLALDYWGGYMSLFDPRMALEESRWTMGEFKNDSGEIILRYRKSDNDARLKIFREGGIWKVGLDESFSTRQ